MCARAWGFWRSEIYTSMFQRINLHEIESRPILSNRTFCDESSVSLLFSVAATTHMQLLSTWKVVNVTKKLNFKLYFILINLNSNVSSEMWLVASILNIAVLVIDLHMENTQRGVFIGRWTALQMLCIWKNYDQEETRKFSSSVLYPSFGQEKAWGQKQGVNFFLSDSFQKTPEGDKWSS